MGEMQGRESFVQQKVCEAGRENDPGKKSDDGDHHRKMDSVHIDRNIFNPTDQQWALS